MAFYAEKILPYFTDRSCAVKPIAKQREKVVPLASGVVLEIGFGSGLNLPFYQAAKVDKLFALEPSPGMRKLAAERVAASPLQIDYLDLPGEAIPLQNASVDTVLMTYTLCTITDTAKALAGIRRVLKPNGRLLFSEHGRAPEAGLARWQDRINPVWRILAGGCNINRKIDDLIIAAGFVPETFDEMFIPGPRLVSYNYWGSARACE